MKGVRHFHPGKARKAVHKDLGIVLSSFTSRPLNWIFVMTSITLEQCLNESPPCLLHNIPRITLETIGVNMASVSLQENSTGHMCFVENWFSLCLPAGCTCRIHPSKSGYDCILGTIR